MHRRNEIDKVSTTKVLSLMASMNVLSSRAAVVRSLYLQVFLEEADECYRQSELEDTEVILRYVLE